MTAGYILPSDATPPMNDVELEDTLHDWVVGCSGLDGTLARPAFQEDVPNLPSDASTDWCAFWFSVVQDQNDYQQTQDNGLTTISVHHETLSLRVSFYGATSRTLAAYFRDNIRIAQNREVLGSLGLKLKHVDNAMPALGELIKSVWYRRVDVTLQLRRAVSRTYTVPSILSASGTVQTEQQTISFEVQDNG